MSGIPFEITDGEAYLGLLLKIKGIDFLYLPLLFHAASALVFTEEIRPGAYQAEEKHLLVCAQ